jgi:hypothetical protein
MRHLQQARQSKVHLDHINFIYYSKTELLNQTTYLGCSQPIIFRSIVVSMQACHAWDPGSIPGGRDPPTLKEGFVFAFPPSSSRFFIISSLSSFSSMRIIYSGFFCFHWLCIPLLLLLFFLWLTFAVGAYIGRKPQNTTPLLHMSLDSCLSAWSSCPQYNH